MKVLYINKIDLYIRFILFDKNVYFIDNFK